MCKSVQCGSGSLNLICKTKCDGVGEHTGIRTKIIKIKLKYTLYNNITNNNTPGQSETPT